MPVTILHSLPAPIKIRLRVLENDWTKSHQIAGAEMDAAQLTEKTDLGTAVYTQVKAHDQQIYPLAPEDYLLILKKEGKQ
jgi:hypothetical protein